MKKTIKNVLIILKKLKFTKYFWIFGIFLFMLTNFSLTSLLTDSSINTESNVLDEIKDLFEKNVEKKKFIYKFLDEFKKEKEVEILTSGEIVSYSSVQKLGDTNKYLVGTKNKGFWLLKFNNDGLVVQANKIQGTTQDINVSILTTDGGISDFSSIQSLENNKYLIGTGTKGFWLLEFDDSGLVIQANKIQDKNEVDVSTSMGGDGSGSYSSIQKLGNTNKYLVGTYNKGFWLLEFDNGTNKFSIAKKIEGDSDVDVLVLTIDNKRVGQSSSIQSLGNNKYLVGTGTKGFYLLEFNNDENKFSIANKIQSKADVDVTDLITDGDVGNSSSIQSLGNNKYLVGTGTSGFWLLEFDDRNNQFTANKIHGKADVDVLNLITNTSVGEGSSIQTLENNKYLVGTFDQGFWLLKFNNDGLVVKANKIQGKDNVDVSTLMGGDKSSRHSSIQKLGDTNKYLVGTQFEGFWLLEFDNSINKFIKANKIKKIVKVTNNEFDGFYNEKKKNLKMNIKNFKLFQILKAMIKFFEKSL